MRAPAFWSRTPDRPGYAARLLAPLAWVWAGVTRRRLARGPGVRLGVPVICVGNATAGGTGKTPTVAAIVQRLGEQGRVVHVVSRGYGGRLAGPVRVDERRHSAAEVGDEPLLLAAFGPVWVGRDRAVAARAAVAAGAEIVVLDDGFQNPGLHKDLSIIVVDAGQGFGNGRVIPAGPLREPVAAGLARAQMMLVAGPPEARAAFLAGQGAKLRLPRLEAEISPLATGLDWRGLRVFAFAGIGRPEKFFATLRGLGAEVVATRGFADHAPYHHRMLARLEADARALGAQLATTEKDAVRLPPAFRSRVRVLPVRLAVTDWEPLDTALARLARQGGV